MPRLVALVLSAIGLVTGCQPAPVVGAACLMPSDCHQPLLCRYERCRTTCTLNAECPLGATCLLNSRGEGICGASQDQGCEGTVHCDPDLVCVLDRCLGRCRDATDCPADGVCAAAAGTTSRICFDIRTEIADAEVPDAASSDAASSD